jgi:U3 small nucleolar RNA-associated protein 10
MSSLAAQLAKNASLNSDLLLSRRKRSESYLFSGRETDLHDLDTIHGLAVNGLLQLTSVNPVFRTYQDILFSNAVKNVDRTMLSVEADADLDKHLAKFLPILGPYLMDAPSGKVIEWLVRRFRYVNYCACSFRSHLSII